MFTQAFHSANSWVTERLARGALATLASSLALAGAALAQAPTAGQSINLVSGRTLPGGDPFLQRQNEPSLAVSSRNPRHLLAGANDYRSVDRPGLPGGTETGDSWLGLFKSFDGGETWQSTLLPGYPQDDSPEGLASPLKGYTAAADPMVRAGTHGLFYYGGFAFNRSTNLGVLHVTTFIDLNNRENGELALARDPIQFAGTVVSDTGTSGQFLDRPWLAVDLPRAGALSRTFNPGGDPQTVPCGNLYLAWAKFTGSHSTKIMLARSRDCGVSWDNPTKLSESSSINQGAVISVGPDGAVYVAWRRFAAGSDGDAILFAKSTDFGQTFPKASVVAPAVGDPSFDQASDPTQSPDQTAFRINGYPTLVVSASGEVHLTWAEKPAAGGSARVVRATSTDGGNTWSAPAAVDDPPIVDQATPHLKPQLLARGPVQAATCIWNVPSGNWNVVANWSGCSDAPGPSTRTPGATDTALIGSGAASFNVDATVAEFEIGAGAFLTLIGGAPHTLTVSSALRLNGGTLSTANTGSFPILYVILGAGGSGQVLATSTLSNTVELENRGTLQLMSASGTALNLLDLSRVITVSGATLALGGGNSRVHLDGQVPLTIQSGGTLATSGDVFIGKSIVSIGAPRIESFGTIAHSGPGTLTIQGGTDTPNRATFQVEGQLTISGGTVLCNGVVDNCRHQNGSGGSANLRIELANGTYSRGGPTGSLYIPPGSKLVGSGTIDGTLGPSGLSGLLAPGAESGLPYGNLSITGATIVTQSAELLFDLGGSAPGSYDTLSVGGNARFAGSASSTLRLRIAPGFAPALDTTFPLVTYASVLVQPDEPVFDLVDSNYALDFATRFTPTTLEVFPAPRISIDDASLVEGNAGSATMTFNVRLSQPSTQTVTAQLRNFDGTAIEGAPPGGDYAAVATQQVTFAPGETLRPATATIYGDTSVEADEAFRLEMARINVSNAALGNSVRGSPNAAGTIVSDDLPPGTRFVQVGTGNGSTHIRRYTSTGTYIDTWNTQQPGGSFYPNTGQCFAPNGDVLATRFAYTSPILFSRHGAVRNATFGGTPTLFFNRHESCVFDRAGNAYVGQAGFNASEPDAQVPVLKFNPSGVLLDSFVLPTGTRGTDWIDLAGDQCTLYYTSEDTSVRRYNVCTGTVLPVFATGLTEPYCYALRLRPNRELMVACQEAVHRLSPQGANLQTYTRQSIGETNAQGLFALNLDPDGTSFWTAGALSGNVYRVDIASGAVLTTFNSGAGGVSGLAVYDQLGDDTIFMDGFDSPPPLAPIESAAECERLLWTALGAMPHYVPDWVSPDGRETCR